MHYFKKLKKTVTKEANKKISKAAKVAKKAVAVAMDENPHMKKKPEKTKN